MFKSIIFKPQLGFFSSRMRAVHKSAHGGFEDGFEEIFVLGAAGGEALEPLGDEGGGGGIGGGGWGGNVFVAVVTAGGSMGEL